MDGRIWTYTGGTIEPLNPNPKDIRIEDIAHALSNQCRFTGHTRTFYSVAQHCMLVSDLLEEHGKTELMLAGLLHDASEAYLSDLARPVKRHPDIDSVYREAESRLMEAVSVAFDVDFEPREIVLADDALLRAEAQELMPDTFPFLGPLQGEFEWEWSHRIIPMAPRVAEECFIETYNSLIGVEV